MTHSKVVSTLPAILSYSLIIVDGSPTIPSEHVNLFSQLASQKLGNNLSQWQSAQSKQEYRPSLCRIDWEIIMVSDSIIWSHLSLLAQSFCRTPYGSIRSLRLEVACCLTGWLALKIESKTVSSREVFIDLICRSYLVWTGNTFKRASNHFPVTAARRRYVMPPKKSSYPIDSLFS